MEATAAPAGGLHGLEGLELRWRREAGGRLTTTDDFTVLAHVGPAPAVELVPTVATVEAVVAVLAEDAVATGTAEE